MEEGPWFWGREGLFLVPRFLEFDSNTLSMTRMHVSVCYPNPPLQFWSILEMHSCRYIEVDVEKAKVVLATHACICVEVDLSKGLLDK